MAHFPISILSSVQQRAFLSFNGSCIDARIIPQDSYFVTRYLYGPTDAFHRSNWCDSVNEGEQDRSEGKIQFQDWLLSSN